MRYWKRININGNTITVESYSHNLPIEGAIEIDETEFNDFIAYIASLPKPEPVSPFQAEWDTVTTNTKKIEILAKALGIKIT